MATTDVRREAEALLQRNRRAIRDAELSSRRLHEAARQSEKIIERAVRTLRDVGLLDRRRH
jgi:hypothetical protein